MKLFLASNGEFLIQKGYDLLGLKRNEIKIAYITTASNLSLDKSYIETHKKSMIENRLFFEEIDIIGRTQEDLKNFFSDKNIIHVEGSNAFYLLKAMREAGCDEIIKDLVGKGVIYVGTSAGAYLACATIETSAWGPKKKDDCGVTDLRGFGLVPFTLKAHYKDELRDLFSEKIKTASVPVRILRDGQGILVEDELCTFVGEGEEVKL